MAQEQSDLSIVSQKVGSVSAERNEDIHMNALARGSNQIIQGLLIYMHTCIVSGCHICEKKLGSEYIAFGRQGEMTLIHLNDECFEKYVLSLDDKETYVIYFMNTATGGFFCINPIDGKSIKKDETTIIDGMHLIRKLRKIEKE